MFLVSRFRNGFVSINRRPPSLLKHPFPRNDPLEVNIILNKTMLIFKHSDGGSIILSHTVPTVLVNHPTQGSKETCTCVCIYICCIQEKQGENKNNTVKLPCINNQTSAYFLRSALEPYDQQATVLTLPDGLGETLPIYI